MLGNFGLTNPIVLGKTKLVGPEMAGKKPNRKAPILLEKASRGNLKDIYRVMMIGKR